jgi:hypothetical protein
MTNEQHKVREEKRQLQDKKLYFLLAAAGTSIGFSVTQIQSEHANSALFILILSLLLLGGSFLSGLMALEREEGILYVNWLYLGEIDKAKAHGVPKERLREIMEENAFGPLNTKFMFWRKLQIWTLFIGGSLLPIWKLASCKECVLALTLYLK